METRCKCVFKKIFFNVVRKIAFLLLGFFSPNFHSSWQSFICYTVCTLRKDTSPNKNTAVPLRLHHVIKWAPEAEVSWSLHPTKLNTVYSKQRCTSAYLCALTWQQWHHDGMWMFLCHSILNGLSGHHLKVTWDLHSFYPIKSSAKQT